MKRSYYSKPISQFLSDSALHILGELALNHYHALDELQRNAWLKQIEILKGALVNLHGHVFFEFSIPRMGKRVDNILIIKDLIFVVEFKVGESKYEKSAIDQVMDYSLDLKNFHEGSHNAKIFPILVSTNAIEANTNIKFFNDKLFSTLFANQNNLNEVISKCFIENEHFQINPIAWERSTYKPTPTIVEAAQALYRGHNVQEISRADSGAINLSKTSDCINKIIEQSKTLKQKSICFVTGVPGAGKTLAGLNIANQRMKIAEDEHAVFLSGNGPLVDVLREALTRNDVEISKGKGEKITKKQAAQKANSFIQNIHHFRDDCLVNEQAPIEKVIIFDEAQRAWTKKQVRSFMKVKKGIENFNMSEPQFLIDVMDRHGDWCTVICLIGGGQEINTGEAGLEEWINALKQNYPEWKIHFSDLILRDINYLKNEQLKNWLINNGRAQDNLHLSVSIRSFRSEKLSDFIQAFLNKDIELGRNLYANHLENDYPIKITRNFQLAKKWLKSKARGSERIGVVASSGAYRLRPFGINVKSKINAPIWFLNGKDDVRSSYFMEEVATEFDIQGLELDWTCVCWDADFYFENEDWNYRKFSGTKWKNINVEITRSYLMNAYRVLLTRARQGLIIFIPEGDLDDKTRLPRYYDETFQYLKDFGLEEIK
ncbi:MAG: DUF2075 domain-containing protein [Pyrinomonadaceae bacterium]